MKSREGLRWMGDDGKDYDMRTVLLYNLLGEERVEHVMPQAVQSME